MHSSRGQRGLSTLRNKASFIKKETTEHKQDQWNNKSEYILSLIGFAVGIGNIWRFPYLAQKYGGGAFVFAYLVMVLVEGLPLFCLELAIGNHFKKSVTGSMKHIHKALVGVGWCTMAVCFLCMLYYNSIIMWIIRYLFESFVDPLPWAAPCTTNHTCCETDKTQFYWYYEHLGISDNIEEIGTFNPTLVICLVIAWVTIFVCIARGIATTGKVVYFSATAPYVVLIILLFRGVTLEGAKDGIIYFLTPEVCVTMQLPWLPCVTMVTIYQIHDCCYGYKAHHCCYVYRHCCYDRFKILSRYTNPLSPSPQPKQLLDVRVWSAAASQIFYSLGIGFGAIVSFASFTKNCDNIIRDSIIITVVNCSTSILGGFVIFSIIGYRQAMTHVEISKMENGPGLAFVAIAEAVANMHISPLWAVLFYSMLLLLGVDSLFGLMESLLHQLREELPFVRRVKKHVFNAFVCFTMFLLALPTATSGGVYMINLIDGWAVSIPLLVVALGEIVAIMWFYGIHRFTSEVYEATGYRIGWYWQICWLVISPACLVVIACLSIYSQLQNRSYEQFIGCPEDRIGKEYEYTMNGTDAILTWTRNSKLPTPALIGGIFLLFM
eukprot:sb/3463159/